MNILGTWYWNPGDIPADFVYPVVLHADGRAEWMGGSGGVQRYVVAQDRLYIGPRDDMHSVFELGDDRDGLLGEIRTPTELDDEELEYLPEEERAGPNFFTDSVMLLRQPGNLRVIMDPAGASDARPLADDQQPQLP